MKVMIDIDAKKLRPIAHMLIVKPPEELKDMSDEKLVLTCVKRMTGGIVADVQIYMGVDENLV